jgi:hypothetical protein
MDASQVAQDLMERQNADMLDFGLPPLSIHRMMPSIQ